VSMGEGLCVHVWVNCDERGIGKEIIDYFILPWHKIIRINKNKLEDAGRETEKWNIVKVCIIRFLLIF